MNTKTMFEPFAENFFRYVSKDIGWTYKHWYFFNKKVTLDHVLTKGFKETAFGKIVDFGPSDHLPIWVELAFQ